MWQLLESTLFWGGVLLAFGGIFTFAFAATWNRGARALRFFDPSVNRKSGEKVMWYGAAAAVFGFFVLYVLIKGREPRWPSHPTTPPAAAATEDR